MSIEHILSDQYPLSDPHFVVRCRDTLDERGVLVLPDFIKPDAILEMKREGLSGINDAYFCANSQMCTLHHRMKRFRQSILVTGKWFHPKG